MILSELAADRATRFNQYKNELASSMKQCKGNFDQYNKLMFSMTELLSAGIDSVQKRRTFNFTSSLALEASYGILNSITNPPADKQYELLLIKFASVFVPFMEELDGYYARPDELDFEKYKHKLQAKSRDEHLMKVLSAQEASRKRKKAATDQLDDVTAAKIDQPSAGFTISITTGETEIDLPGTSGQQLWHAPGEIKDENQIKEEEPDYDETMLSTSHAMPAGVNGAHEIKDESMTEVKEEPIDDLREQATRGEQGVIDLQAAIDDVTRMRNHQTCTHCGLKVLQGSMEEHVKLNHKDHWLEYVHKCPEKECDFRSDQPTAIALHRQEIHNERYRTWQKQHSGKRFKFETLPATNCPFCTVELLNIAQFIRHMEQAHPRLCTYEVPILKCRKKGCCFTTSRSYRMFEHWHDQYPSCSIGMEFLYTSATQVIHADRARTIQEKSASKYHEQNRKRK